MGILPMHKEVVLQVSPIPAKMDFCGKEDTRTIMIPLLQVSGRDMYLRVMTPDYMIFLTSKHRIRMDMFMMDLIRAILVRYWEDMKTATSIVAIALLAVISLVAMRMEKSTRVIPLPLVAM